MVLEMERKTKHRNSNQKSLEIKASFYSIRVMVIVQAKKSYTPKNKMHELNK